MRYFAKLLKNKMFLCSRDIQIGDKDIHTGIMQDYGEEIVKEVKFQHQLDFMHCVSEVNETELFKIIGEISPGAIWVKEGDEFDEREVEQRYRDEDSRYYKIKCPQCNTFH